MARLAIDAVRTASRLAEQEQRRRRRKRQLATKDTAVQDKNSQGGSIDPNAPQRQPEFDMPTKADGEIPDEFLSQW